MALIGQNPPKIHNLQAKIKDLESQLRTLQDENHQLRRQQGISFYLFINLPFEIRASIWEYALPDRRVLRVSDLPVPDLPNVYHSAGIFFCSAYPPALLHVCQESRKVALTQFKSFFEKGWRGEISRPIYFRPKLDVLYLDSERLGGIARDNPEINEIESIAIPNRLCTEPERIWSANNQPCFQGMKRLLLVEASEWPSNRCCATVELSPDAASKQKELKWTEYIARQRDFDPDYVPNIQQVEAVVAELVYNNSYF